MKIVVITGNALRHKYFVKRLLNNYDVEKVYFQKSYSTFKLKLLNKKLKNLSFVNKILRIITVVFSKIFKNDIVNRITEKKYFNSQSKIEVKYNHSYVHNINESQTIEEIKSIRPDILIVFGGKIVNSEIIKSAKNYSINLHTGQSPYYRGTHTNLWPFLYNDLTRCGFTLHLLNNKPDAGDILVRGRPQITNCDTRHTVFCKSIILGVEELLNILNYYKNGNKINAEKQNLNEGRLFLSKDYTFLTELKYKIKLRKIKRSQFIINKSIEKFYI